MPILLVCMELISPKRLNTNASVTLDTKVVVAKGMLLQTKPKESLGM
ncbi:MAG: hypothetical protein LBL58_13065 [Tannerellaceae bacterium]|jgi:hypothetical protein|nr:hypothetical protein [Tannerellaceae bacterium]